MLGDNGFLVEGWQGPQKYCQAGNSAAAGRGTLGGSVTGMGSQGPARGFSWQGWGTGA